MVLSYTELEISYAHIAGLMLGLKFEVLNAAEKIYSETQKIKVIHALCHRAFEKAGYTHEYHTTYKMMFYCAGLRNTYAHSQWLRNYGKKRLEFIDSNEMFDDYQRGFENLDKRVLPLKLLRQQAAYFELTRKWLLWFDLTLRQRGVRHPETWTKPPEMPPPPKHYVPPSPKRAPKRPAQTGRRPKRPSR